jgi:hypothetical protein
MAEGNSILLEAIKRFLLIIAAYLLCCVLTGFSVLGLLTIADPPSDLSTFSFGLFITVIISFFAALPAAIFVCVVGLFGLRRSCWPWHRNCDDDQTLVSCCRLRLGDAHGTYFLGHCRKKRWYSKTTATVEGP